MKRRLLIIVVLALVAGVAHAETGQRIATWLRSHQLAPELIVVLVTMVPIVELRGALPIGYNLLGLPLLEVLLLCIVGNMIPIFFVLLFLEGVVVGLGRIPLFQRFFDWLFRRTRAKAAGIERDEFWGLAVFVGIPLPGTGAWTGAIAAVLLGLPYWRAILAIFIGVMMAAAAVTVPCVLFRKSPGLGMVIVIAVLTALLIGLIVRAVRRAKSESPS